jgi:murein DD-endopeptidase MepM/ murein hydrolase activator NlpD
MMKYVMKPGRIRVASILSMLLIILIPSQRVVFAQDLQPVGPIYIVQEGDTLWDIAQRFGVTLEDLARENSISDPAELSAGDELIIPGIEGVNDVLVTRKVPLGENLRSLSRRFKLPEKSIIRLNHITSPVELFNGYNLVVPASKQEGIPNERLAMASGQSLFELAINQDVNPWALATNNDLVGTWSAVPGDVLIIPDQESEDGPGGLPGEISSLDAGVGPLTQGKLSVIRLEATEELVAGGSLAGNPLNFFHNGDGEYIALQGIHALIEPGLHSLVLEGELKNGVPFSFSQMLLVSAGDYTYKSLQVPPETIDPANTKPEDEIWNALPKSITPVKMWEGVFQSPVAPSPCGFTDTFGHRRSYNGSPYNYFHTGLDFCYNYNNEVNEIYAPADGVVVFADSLVVRGNATLIDHGWGVYTGYMHQEEILVEVGEQVETGQVIGIVGQTGRVNGPHLHLEVWAGGVQVDPIDWLENPFP